MPDLRGLDKDVRELVEEFKPLGWSPTRTRGGHIKLVHPHGAIEFLPSTPSDYRGIRNSRASLRRKTEAIRQQEEGNTVSVAAVPVESSVEQPEPIDSQPVQDEVQEDIAQPEVQEERQTLPLSAEEDAHLEVLRRAAEEEAADEQAIPTKVEEPAPAPTNLPRKGSLQRKVYDLLASSETPLTVHEVALKARALDKQTYPALYQLGRRGLIKSLGDGTYGTPEHAAQARRARRLQRAQQPERVEPPALSELIVAPDPPSRPTLTVMPDPPPISRQESVFETVLVGVDGRMLLRADDGTLWLAQKLSET